MKKNAVILLSILMAVGMVACTNEDIPQEEKNVAPTIDGSTKESDVEGQVAQDSLLITGIIVDANAEMMTLAEVEGLDGEYEIIANLNKDTVYDVSREFMTEGKFVKVEVTSMMTKSILPQCNALRVIEINDIVIGEVLEADDFSIRLRPLSNLYGNQEIIVIINENTKWRVVKESVVGGQIIRVMIDSKMTASVPPQVNGISILSIETRD